jgi:hypothetical protein
MNNNEWWDDSPQFETVRQKLITEFEQIRVGASDAQENSFWNLWFALE